MRFSFSNCTRLALALAVFPILVRAQSAPPDTQAPPPASPKQLSDASRDETEGNITSLVPRLLQALHYSHHPFDAEISSKFLDRYLDTLDHWHLYFLQSDLDQFEVYRTNLPMLSVRLRDFSPSTVIFSRFLQRATERTSFVTNSLHTDAFEFTNHDSFIANRHTLPNPTNLNDARRLWEEELRYEYLDEKLKESDMAVSGPASLDAQSNAVIFLPLEYTNSLSAAFLAARAKRTDESPLQNESGRAGRTSAAPAIRTVESLLPGKLLDQEHHAFGSVTATPSNVIVRLQIPPEATLRKTTNNFYSEDGRRLGSIRFLHPADTASGTNRGIAKIQPPGQANLLPADASWATNLPAPAEAGPAPALKGLVDLNRKDSEEIVHTLTKRYTGLLKNYTDLTNDDYVLEEYLTSLAHAYDPHSDYMRSDSTENFDIQMHLSLVGIGARLRSEDGDCKIEDLVPEGPAAKSGLITNEDTILAVAQKDQEPVFVTGMPLQKVVDMIRGPKGTPVALTILMAHPADPSVRQKTITLIRDVIELDDQAAKARIYQTPADSGAPPLRVGVIDLPSFYANPDTGKPGDPPSAHPTTTFKDVFRIISRFKKENVDGIILDLRRNGGGFLDQAISLTGLFARGPVVQTREPDEGPARLGSIEVSSTGKGPALYDGPLIVLTSRFSASASEIVAGALQDYGRALIVGDNATFGKGTVQMVQPMSNFMARQRMLYSYDPGSIKITIKKFYRAGGSSTQSNGVASDIVLPSELNYADVGESALPNPMPWDEISSADDLPEFNLVKPYLPELTKRSLHRRETDKDFAYLQEDINEYRKALADKSISLDEEERLTEQKATEARFEARKKERASRPKSGEEVFEITLKNVDLAGLSAPEVKPKPAASPTDDADPLDAAAAVPEDPAASDPALTETRRIMADYISLLKKPQTTTAKQP